MPDNVEKMRIDASGNVNIVNTLQINSVNINNFLFNNTGVLHEAINNFNNVDFDYPLEILLRNIIVNFNDKERIIKIEKNPGFGIIDSDGTEAFIKTTTTSCLPGKFIIDVETIFVDIPTVGDIQSANRIKITNSPFTITARLKKQDNTPISLQERENIKFSFFMNYGNSYYISIASEGGYTQSFVEYAYDDSYDGDETLFVKTFGFNAIRTNYDLVKPPNYELGFVYTSIYNQNTGNNDFGTIKILPNYWYSINEEYLIINGVTEISGAALIWKPNQ
jgi:hypothetical protein